MYTKFRSQLKNYENDLSPTNDLRLLAEILRARNDHEEVVMVHALLHYSVLSVLFSAFVLFFVAVFWKYSFFVPPFLPHVFFSLLEMLFSLLSFFLMTFEVLL